MSSAKGEILYIGESGDLRTRLGSYRNGNPEHLPRKVVRMIHMVASITWEECRSKRLAKVRENELLRLHRPRFNRMNTFPQAYCFIGIQKTAKSLDLFWTRDTREGRGLFGAFKAGAIHAFSALCRTIWSARHQPKSPYDLPRQLVVGRIPHRFNLQFETEAEIKLETAETWLRKFFSGESDELLESMRREMAMDHLALFHQNLIQSDLETLTHFYRTGPSRLRRLKREHGLEEELVLKEELDDLIALSERPADPHNA